MDVATEKQPIAFQHTGGEVFMADTLEAARGMCPVLGKLSLEEAGLLLELEQMGNDLISKDDFEEAAPPDDKGSTPPVGGKELGIMSPVSVTEKEAIQYEISKTESSKVQVLHEHLESIRTQEISTARGAPLLTKPKAPELVEAKDNIVPTEFAQVREPSRATDVADSHVLAPEEAHEDKSDVVLPHEPVQQQDNERATIDTSTETPREEVTETLAVDANELVIEPYIAPTPALVDHFEIVQTETLPDTEADVAIGPRFVEYTETHEEVGGIVDELTVLVGGAEIESTEMAAQIDNILSEIIAVTEAPEEEGLATDTGANERIEELFVELFAVLQLEHKPEHIKLLRELSMRIIERSANDAKDEPSSTPIEIGTREFLQKIRYGLSSAKLAVAHFYQVGKSALKLCVLNTSPA